MTATLGGLKTAYDTLSNKDEQAVDFLIMGRDVTQEIYLNQKQII